MSSGSFFRRPAVLLALALCSVGGVVTLLGRLATGPPVTQKRTPLSNEAGTESYPAFSPDGQRLAYSGRSTANAGPFHIFIRAAGADRPRQLTSGDGNDVSPAWSPDGSKIAFLRMQNGRATYLAIPVDGGAERQVAEGFSMGDDSQPLPAVAWTPDSKALVIARAGEKSPPVIAVAALDGGNPRPLTSPSETSTGDTTPAVSPDGTTIAFVRASPNEGADIFLCDPSGGNPRRLTFDDRPIRGLAWTPDSHDLVYASDRARGWRLWRLPVFGGSPHELNIAGGRARYPAVAAAGNRLVYSDSTEVSAIWRAALDSKPSDAKSSETPTSEDRPLIRSVGREWWPMYSPDGKRIADFSTQDGNDQIWVSDSEGGNRVQLTHIPLARMGRLRWSPDSKSLLFDAATGGEPNLYAIAVANSRSTMILHGGTNASWSNDGKHIYYNRNGQIWKSLANAGNPELLVAQFGAAQPVESPDGKFVYYRMRRSFFRVPSAGGESEEIIDPDHTLFWTTTIQISKKGVYYLEFDRSSRTFVVSLYDFAAKTSSPVFRFHNMDFGSPTFSISPDARWVIYPRVDQSQTDLMLIENFR